MVLDSILEELRKETRRNEIRGKISDLRAKISDVNATKQAYSEYAGKIRTSMENWRHQLQGYQQIALSNPVNEKDSFEGVCADGYAVSMPTAIRELNSTESQMAAVVSGIQDQIAKIDEYIEKLQLEIDVLEIELAGI